MFAPRPNGDEGRKRFRAHSCALERRLLTNGRKTRSGPAWACLARRLKDGEKAATILVVDDDDDVREVTGDLLESAGYHVLSAHDGHAALDTLGSHPGIDLMPTDAVMPGGIDGFVLRALAMAEHPGLSVLLMTGYSEAPGQDLPLLHKPYTRDGLLTTLERLLAGGTRDPESRNSERLTSLLM